MQIRNIYLITGKITITILLIVYLIEDLNVSSIIDKINSIGVFWFMLVVFIGLFQIFINSIRWIFVCKILGVEINKLKSISYSLIGQFFNQILPSSIGGDAAKIWAAVKDGYPLGRITSSVLADRIIGMVVVLMLGLISIAMISADEGSRIRYSPRIIFYITTCSLFVFLLFYRYGYKIIEKIKKYKKLKSIGILLNDLWLVFYSKKNSLIVIFLSIIIQLTITFSIYILAFAIGASLSFIKAIYLVPLIMLATMVPISLAGWGVREAAMVFGLGLEGVSEINALSISIMFGLSQVVLGLFGWGVWLKKWGVGGRNIND